MKEDESQRSEEYLIITSEKPSITSQHTSDFGSVNRMISSIH